MATYGYLGPQGTFTETALNSYLKKQNITAETIPYNSIFTLFEKYAQKECDAMITPLENAIEGPVAIVLDQLVSCQNGQITHEIEMPIQQSLLTPPGTQKKAITDIISFPHALAQCQGYLYKELEFVQIHHSTSTAASVDLMESLQKNSPEKQFGIVGNSDLTKYHALVCLENNIQDHDNNTTRFGIISPLPSKIVQNGKTSIVFSTHQDKPGSLYHILGEFEKKQINLTQIISRPTKNKLGEYLFFVDIEGASGEMHIQETLKEIEKMALYYKCIGSYERTSLCLTPKE